MLKLQLLVFSIVGTPPCRYCINRWIRQSCSVGRAFISGYTYIHIIRDHLDKRKLSVWVVQDCSQTAFLNRYPRISIPILIIDDGFLGFFPFFLLKTISSFPSGIFVAWTSHVFNDLSWSFVPKRNRATKAIGGKSKGCLQIFFVYLAGYAQWKSFTKNRETMYTYDIYICIYATDICIRYCTQFYIPQTTNMMFGRLRGNFSPKLPKTCRALHPHCCGHLEFRWLFSYHRRWWNQGTCGPPIRMKHLPGSFATPSLSCIRTFNRRFGGSFQVKVQRDLGTHGFPWRNSRIPTLFVSVWGLVPQKTCWSGSRGISQESFEIFRRILQNEVGIFFSKQQTQNRPGPWVLFVEICWNNEPPSCPHKILDLKTALIRYVYKLTVENIRRKGWRAGASSFHPQKIPWVLRKRHTWGGFGAVWSRKL